MLSIPREGLSKASVDGYLMRQQHSGGGLDYSLILRAPNDLPTLRNYYAQISMVDDGVGQVMAALERLGISDNTLFIFTSDHGLSVGQHGFWGHGSATFPSNLHHAAHSVPLIVRHAPTVDAGQRSEAMVSNMERERVNLIDEPEHAEIRSQLDKMLTDFFATHSRQEADLWQGGTALQHSERNEFWRDAWGGDWQTVYRYE